MKKKMLWAVSVVLKKQSSGRITCADDHDNLFGQSVFVASTGRPWYG